MHLLTTRLKTGPKYYCTCSSNYLCVLTLCWYNLLGSDQLIKYHLYTKVSVYMQVFCIDSFPSGRRCFFFSLRMYFFVNLNSGWTSRWLWLYFEAVEWLVGFFVVLSSSTCCEGLVCFLSTLQPKPLYNLMKNHFRNLSCLIMKANGIIMVIFACRYCSIVISC